MIEIKVYQALLNDADIKKNVGDRVFPLIAKNGTKAPYITYQNINDKELTSIQGESYGNKTRFQVDIFSESYIEALKIAGAVKNAVFGLSETVYEYNSSDIPPEQETGLYRRLIEFYINN